MEEITEKSGIAELEKNLENLHKEEKLYPPKRDRLVRLKERTQERIDIHETMFPILAENIRKIEPVTEFEKLDEYWDCQKRILKLEHESNVEKMQEEVDNIENQIGLVDNEMKRIEDGIPVIEQQIKNLRGE